MKNRKTERRKTVKALRGELRREQNKLLLGGAAKGNRLREQAAALRLKHHLCPHSDDERVYGSQAEADADKSQAVICEACRKTEAARGARQARAAGGDA